MSEARTLAIFNNTIQLAIALRHENKPKTTEEWASFLLHCEGLARGILTRIEAGSDDFKKDNQRFSDAEMLDTITRHGGIGSYGSIGKAARELGVSPSAIYLRMERLKERRAKEDQKEALESPPDPHRSDFKAKGHDAGSIPEITPTGHGNG